MASAVNIVLADAAATPVNHTFIPIGPDNNHVYYFEDQSAASAVGFWRTSLALTRPASAKPGEDTAGRVYRAKIALHEPVLETISNSTVSGIAPAPQVAYIPRANVEFILPERGVLLDRKNIRKMLFNLMNDPQVIAMVENLVSVY
jgi:hypothetical protein